MGFETSIVAALFFLPNLKCLLKIGPGEVGTSSHISSRQELVVGVELGCVCSFRTRALVPEYSHGHGRSSLAGLHHSRDDR